MTREDWLALARGFVGCGDGNDPVRFRTLVAPEEAPERAAEIAKLSTCGLFVRGLLAALGGQDPRLLAPYRLGRVISDLAAMAREARAVRTPGYLEPGDVVVIGGPEHVMILEEETEPGVWNTIQGGERDAHGAQIIARMRRVLSAGAFGGRSIETGIDFDSLAGKFLP